MNKHTGKVKKTKVEHRYLLGAAGLFFGAAIIISALMIFQVLQQQLFAERQSHLTEMTVKISQVLDITIESVQSKADSAQRMMEWADITDKEDLIRILQTIYTADDLQDGPLLAMDSRGRVYTSDGYEGRWETSEDLYSENLLPVIRELYITGEKLTYMVFFRQLEEPKEIGQTNVYVTHTAVAVPLESMKETFTISLFGDTCYAYLVNQDGRRLFKQTFEENFIEDYNVLSALENEKFLMGYTVDGLRDAIQNREQFCAEFQMSKYDMNYFVSTTPIEDSSWTVLLFVPTQVLGANTSRLLNTMLAYFVLLAVGIVIVLVCLLVSVLAWKNDKKFMTQQELNNQLLAQAAERAESANQAKSEFLSHMSHDIRTPINGIVGMTNIAMKNTHDPERITDCLQKISGSADHLLTLINDVLDMSRIESGKTEIAHAPMDVRTLVDNCVSIVSGQLIGRQVELVLDVGEFAHPFLLGDELHLRQVFINILGNAVKFTPDGGTITFSAHELSCQDDRAQYRFKVADTGIGMSEQFQSKIFDAFAQEDGGSRTTYKGTGLGMSITKQFIDLMDGTITVESRLNEGSCFTVDMAFDVNGSYASVIADHGQVCLEGLRVLLVEDNELNIEIAQEILSDEGVIVTCVENGQLAVDAFTGAAPGTFDVILMDIMMPVLNGYEATMAIRASAHPQAKTIPIVAMTANAYAEDVQAALAAGMNAHVAKPVDLERLFTVLSRYREQQ